MDFLFSLPFFPFNMSKEFAKLISNDPCDPWIIIFSWLKNFYLFCCDFDYFLIWFDLNQFVETIGIHLIAVYAASIVVWFKGERERERELLQAQLVHVENSWNYSMALNRREWIRFTPNQYGMRWTADTMELIIDFKRVCGDVYLYRRTEYISSVVTFLQIDSLIFKYVLAVGMCQ